MLIGDAIQNMRAALDHATWGLIVSERSRTFANRNRKSIYFPIYTFATDSRTISSHRPFGRKSEQS